MKHVMYGDKSLLMENDTADWLLEYARALGSVGRVDTVKVGAIGIDGNNVDVILLLNSNTQLAAESTVISGGGVPNDQVLRYMQDQTRLIVAPPEVQAEADWPAEDDD